LNVGAGLTFETSPPKDGFYLTTFTAGTDSIVWS
jgi:hypothetical protein